MSDKPCILRERLFVPEEYVTQDQLDEFTYSFETDERDYDEFGKQQGVTKGYMTVRNFKKIRAKDGTVYYGFARGNLEKLSNLFGDYPWEDRTAAPKMAAKLEVLPSLVLDTFATAGRGQQEVVDQWLKIQNGIIKAAPRFGKTICSVFMICKMGLKTLVVTHQEDLLKQFIKEFEQFSNLLKIRSPSMKRRDATGHIVGMFSDFDNPEVLDVCFVCWQTFASKYGPERLKAYRDSFGVLVCDEVHRQGGLKYASTMNENNARHRLGLTGTLERVDGKERIITDIMGPVVAKGEVVLVDCAVTAIHTGCEVKYKHNEPLPYLYKRLYRDPQRLDIVLKYLREDVKDGFFICVGFHRCSKQQLDHFTELLQGEGINCLAFHGITKDRDGTLEKFRSGEVQVAVCNVGMLTGINIPRWNCFYRMFPSANIVLFKENGKLELSGNDKQEFDRIRTRFTYENGATKRYGLIRDFVDANKFCQGCYQKRLKSYKHQKFIIENIYEEMSKTIKEGMRE